MKHLPFFFVILFFLISCSGNDHEEVPGKIIQKDKMEKILVDIQLVEGAMLYKRSKGVLSDSLRDLYFNLVFDKYNISKAGYEKSLEYYKKHLEEFDEIYKRVVSRLEKMKNN
ncbi:MAG: DUF4296 domain-containing protein [Bacteroidales bacterium]|nr:DUF4296 domain-containing protein [Bacteroidales bacterium]MCF8387402.1 DUF4296 domain-containing protein [Bacteroidales bacterium]MCF8397311.1 DUF4296 domain-containing protein [Bacteroidales bacterium]